MKTTGRVLWSVLLIGTGAGGDPWAQERQEKVLLKIEDFETGQRRLESDPNSPVTMEYSKDTPYGKSCLKVKISPDWDWTWKGWDGKQAPRVMPDLYFRHIYSPFLPPEADAVRMKVKVLSGKWILSVGGPTIHQGNSDVAAYGAVEAAAGRAEWKKIEISLNHGLVRDYRRPEFSGRAPMIYYTRWPHEPMQLGCAHPSQGEILIDDLEFVARGEGRPFPKFRDDQIEMIRTIADFEGKSLTDVSRICYGELPFVSFEQSYLRENKQFTPPLDWERKKSPIVNEEGLRHPAPRLNLVEGSRSGRTALSAEDYWMEECQLVGVKTKGESKANALKFVLKADYPRLMFDLVNIQHEGKASVSVDFLAFVAPGDEPFPWEGFEAADALKEAFKKRDYKGPGARFDYFLCPKNFGLTREPDLKKTGSFGWYHARRYVPHHEWSTAVVPFADFVCVYGQGGCEEMYQKQQPLEGRNIRAVAFFAAYTTDHGTITMDDIAFVHVPGKPEELRSFWQLPTIQKVRLLDTRMKYYDTHRWQSEGEPLPEFLK